VMHQRAAAALPLRHHDLDAEPRQQAQRRLVDTGIEHRLGTAGEDRNASTLLAFGRPLSRTG